MLLLFKDGEPSASQLHPKNEAFIPGKLENSLGQHGDLPGIELGTGAGWSIPIFSRAVVDGFSRGDEDGRGRTCLSQ